MSTIVSFIGGTRKELIKNYNFYTKTNGERRVPYRPRIIPSSMPPLFKKN